MTTLSLPLAQGVEPAAYLYRYDDVRYSNGIDECGDPLPGYYLQVRLSKLRIKHYTPKGARLFSGRFVSFHTTKRYACQTIEEAKESFLARKRKQISIYQARIHQAEKAIKLLEKGDNHDLHFDY